jgi:hypothetical protein
MPPLLLKGDKDFYGTAKPTGKGDFNKLDRPAPPPTPISNVALTTKEARENFKDRVTENIESIDTKEKPVSTDELKETNIKKLGRENDSVMNKVVSFLQTPIIKQTPDQELAQKQREVSRITGKESDAPVENVVRVGEVPSELSNRAFNFIETQAFNLVLLLGGIYIASQFASGVGKGLAKGGGKKYKVEE